jgi:hypothetical protein
MSPYIAVALILLLITATLAAIGAAMVVQRKLRLKQAPRYAQVATVLVCLAFYALTESPWPGLHLRKIDFWSETLILAILAYAMVWAAIARLLNKPEYQQEFGDSFMLSMLYTDSQSPATEIQERPKAH